MRSSKVLSIAIAATLAFVASSQANAMIVNIDAKTGVDVTLAPGRYLVQWIGVANGGAYDAYNANCPTGACTSGWSTGFIETDTPFDPNGTINIYNFGSTYSSAATALNAIKTAASFSHGHFDFVGGVRGPFVLDAPIAQPWLLDIQLGAGSSHLSVIDPDRDLSNNFGGVSFSVVAVPEPSVWAMTIFGLGALGARLRHRRRSVTA